MQPNTHLSINNALCGELVDLSQGGATVQLEATSNMAADAVGLVHGGFVFGLADYAAMLAVNHPNVVLGSAEVRFLAPVRVGETVVARASRSSEAGRKNVLEVSATVGDREVFNGSFVAFVLDHHVLESK